MGNVVVVVVMVMVRGGNSRRNRGGVGYLCVRMGGCSRRLPILVWSQHPPTWVESIYKDIGPVCGSRFRLVIWPEKALSKTAHEGLAGQYRNRLRRFRISSNQIRSDGTHDQKALRRRMW